MKLELTFAGLVMAGVCGYSYLNEVYIPERNLAHSNELIIELNELADAYVGSTIVEDIRTEAEADGVFDAMELVAYTYVIWALSDAEDQLCEFVHELTKLTSEGIQPSEALSTKAQMLLDNPVDHIDCS